jgi:hypothetical protein
VKDAFKVIRTLPLILLFAACFWSSELVLAQKQAKPAAPQTTDVLRINTELVQTDVTVLDKQGRFVDGLTADQFELTLDGKAQPISFFERINTGTAKELAQLATSRRGSTAASPSLSEAEAPGRVILFFLDDLHLSGASLTRARQALSDFVETRLRDTDQVAIVSTSGQIGFLQQLTDEPAVLSSLFLGERKLAIDDPVSAPNAVKVSVDHRFARTSVLRFQTYVGRELSDTATAPDVEIQAIVLRGRKSMLAMPAAKLPIESARATSSPYWAEVPLAELSPGHYRLQVVATNRKTGTSITEVARFKVE